MSALLLRPGVLRPVCVVLVFFVIAAARAEEMDGLYSAVTIITGTGEAERRRGFAACLEEVLVKVSGVASLAGSPATRQLGERAEALVESYSLRDRMAGIPVHDEQGTRERPHVLTVDFSPAKVDQALRVLGHTRWTERPVITLLVGVDNAARRFVLAQDAALGRDQQDALEEIAKRLGLKVELPGEAALAAASVDFASLSGAENGTLGAMRDTLGGEVVLSGVLAWQEMAFRWRSHWRLVSDNSAKEWDFKGASFDAVFRDALTKAMGVLSRADGR